MPCAREGRWRRGVRAGTRTLSAPVPFVYAPAFALLRVAHPVVPEPVSVRLGQSPRVSARARVSGFRGDASQTNPPGHLGLSSRHRSLVSIHPRPGKKSVRWRAAGWTALAVRRARRRAGERASARGQCQGWANAPIVRMFGCGRTYRDRPGTASCRCRSTRTHTRASGRCAGRAGAPGSTRKSRARRPGRLQGEYAR